MTLRRDEEPAIPPIDRSTPVFDLPPTSSMAEVLEDQTVISPPVATDIRLGNKIIWIVGQVEYSDGTGAVYSTPYRMKYLPKTNAFGPAGPLPGIDPT